MKTGLNCFKKVKWQFYSKSFLVFLVSFIRLSMPSFLVCCNFKIDLERGDKKGVVCLPFCKKNNLNNLFTYLLIIILIWNLPQKCLWLYPVFFRIPTCFILVLVHFNFDHEFSLLISTCFWNNKKVCWKFHLNKMW